MEVNGAFKHQSEVETRLENTHITAELNGSVLLVFQKGVDCKYAHSISEVVFLIL